MDRNLECLDLNTLKTLYERETDELNAALLNGVLWNDLREQRKRMMDIALVLQAKRNGEGFVRENPAEHSTRPSE